MKFWSAVMLTVGAFVLAASITAISVYAGPHYDATDYGGGGASLNPFSGTIQSDTTGGPCIMDEAAELTNPVFIPDCEPGTATGIGGDDGLKVSIAVGGISEVEIDSVRAVFSSGSIIYARGGIFDDTGIIEMLNVVGEDTVQDVNLGAAATTFAITQNSATVDCDGGGNTIATITGGGPGVLLTLIFEDSDCTVSDDNTHAADTIDLDASNDFTSADDSTLFLIHDGTSWYRITDSVN